MEARSLSIKYVSIFDQRAFVRLVYFEKLISSIRSGGLGKNAVAIVTAREVRDLERAKLG